MDNILKEQKFTQTYADLYLYTNKENKEIKYLINHINDFLIIAKEINVINEITGKLKGKFNLIGLNILKHCLSIEVRKNEDGFYCIRQTRCMVQLLQKFGLQDAKISDIRFNSGYMKNRCE